MTLLDTCTLFPQIFTVLIKSMETVYLTPAILQMCVDLGQLLHVSYKQIPGNPEPAQVDQMISWSLQASDIRQPIRVWQLPLDCCSASGSSVDCHPDQMHPHQSYFQSHCRAAVVRLFLLIGLIWIRYLTSQLEDVVPRSAAGILKSDTCAGMDATSQTVRIDGCRCPRSFLRFY